MDTSTVDIQDTTAPDFVDSVALIKLAQRYSIPIKDKFMAANTPAARVELRDWVYAQIKAANPDWQPEY